MRPMLSGRMGGPRGENEGLALPPARVQSHCGLTPSGFLEENIFGFGPPKTKCVLPLADLLSSFLPVKSRSCEAASRRYGSFCKRSAANDCTHLGLPGRRFLAETAGLARPTCARASGCCRADSSCRVPPRFLQEGTRAEGEREEAHFCFWR